MEVRCPRCTFIMGEFQLPSQLVVAGCKPVCLSCTTEILDEVHTPLPLPEQVVA
jgi:hypothetical protein